MNRRTRNRRITWFNPPYSMNVKTNIGKTFLVLLNNCFKPGHQLHKIMNRNTIKISYSCMPNMKQAISTHNKAIIEKTNPTPTAPTNCNCRKKDTCPLNGECLTPSIIYQATVTRHDSNKDNTYIGLTDNSFKTRYNGHVNSFKHSSKRNSTTLSQHIWSLKDKAIQYSIKWKILAKAKSFSTASKRCNLCIREKYFIICKPNMASLNTRNELASECRHKKRHLLSNFT